MHDVWREQEAEQKKEGHQRQRQRQRIADAVEGRAFGVDIT